MACHIKLEINSKPTLFDIEGGDGFIGSESTHQGNQIQLTVGAVANTQVLSKVNNNVIIIDNHFSILIFLLNIVYINF